MPRAPDAAFGGRDPDPARRLKRRSRLLEELDLLGGGFSAESGVAVRKAAEARDDLVVASRAFDVLPVGGVKQGKRAPLRREVLRVHERQVDKGALNRREQAVKLPRDRSSRRGERQGIARKRARRAAEHVARKLVEHDDQRERSERSGLPAFALAARSTLPGSEKAAADLRVERFRFLEPQFARPAALARTRCTEPEIEHLDEVRGGQLQSRRLARVINIAGLR